MKKKLNIFFYFVIKQHEQQQKRERKRAEINFFPNKKIKTTTINNENDFDK